MSDIEPKTDVTALTVQLLSAYLANNNVASENLADLIRSTKTALMGDIETEAVKVAPEVSAPAVSVRKSLASPDHIVSLIDGKPYKTLKRHLSSHGLTAQTYRARYNLPASYPTVAPAYAAERRAIAERVGLGRKVKAATPSPAATSVSQDVPTAAPVVAEPETRKKPGPKPSATRAKPKGGKVSAKAASATSSATSEIGAPSEAPKRRGRPPKSATPAAPSGDTPAAKPKLKLALGKKPKVKASVGSVTE